MKNFKRIIKKSLLIIGLPLMLSNFAQAQSGNYFAGPSAGTGNTGFNNIAVGNAVLYSANSGNYNTALGSNTLRVNSSGYSNVAIGGQALYFNSTGFKNCAVGAGAMTYNISGNEVSAFGFEALKKNLASGNSAFGSLALAFNNTGGDNNAFGHKGLFNNTTGEANCSFGSYGLFTNTTGSRNCAFGTYSLDNNTTASGNCGFGFNTLTSNTTGNANVAMGDFTLDHNDIGFFNTAIGATALQLNVSGSNNTAVGTSAGQTKVLYNKCSFFGVQADATTSGRTNAMALGYGALVNGSNKVRVGNTAVTSIGGQVGWTTSSDLRLKENINESKLGLNFILNLHPVTYNYKDEEQRDILYTGLIAQEVDAAAKKEGVEFSGVDKNGEYWGIRYGDLTVPIISSVQQLSKQNDELKRENEQIKAMLVEMKQQINALAGNSDKAKSNIVAPQISIAPNPTSDVATITISSNDKMQNLVVKIVDPSGKIIRTYNATTVTSSFEFNTSTLSKRTYLVQLFNQNELMKTEKLIVQ